MFVESIAQYSTEALSAPRETDQPETVQARETHFAQG